ncbi:uncharacterized protein LOC130625046 [Hydractinia symbiolongicarpus]|uniref:uncharacterized protein LOC130625046 n=1 Tax=Hydractinia symbiolongicarpus TaxID=13093 RepID=UPI00254DF1B0|nr:uncharacterized protein LOC130625046 [Hydractinia symbiolongicarpus]
MAFSTSFREWCYCLYEKEKIQENMWFDCPCCTISQHSCHVDVMCKLWGFIKRKEPGLALKTKPALSVMHAKGHSLNCQVQWDGAWTDGTGKSTGEETEQIFSFLSRCGNSNKHQLPES